MREDFTILGKTFCICAPRGAYNDGGRPTAIANEVEVANNQPLHLTRKMSFVVSGAGKGGINPSCESEWR